MGKQRLTRIAVFGIVAYPALGLYRSMDTTKVTGAQGEILKAQQVYGTYLAEHNAMDKGEVDRVITEFEEKWLKVKEPDQ